MLRTKNIWCRIREDYSGLGSAVINKTMSRIIEAVMSNSYPCTLHICHQKQISEIMCYVELNNRKFYRFYKN